MKIFQALKEKKKLGGEIVVLKQRIQNNNSYIKGNEQDYSVKSTMEELFKKEEELIQLKVKIQRANAPVNEKIFRLAELKGRAQYLKGISTNKGTVKQRFSEDVLEYVVELSKVEIDKMVDQTTSDIYRLQDELDMFNHTTDI